MRKQRDTKVPCLLVTFETSLVVSAMVQHSPLASQLCDTSIPMVHVMLIVDLDHEQFLVIQEKRDQIKYNPGGYSITITKGSSSLTQTISTIVLLLLSAAAASESDLPGCWLVYCRRTKSLSTTFSEKRDHSLYSRTVLHKGQQLLTSNETEKKISF